MGLPDLAERTKMAGPRRTLEAVKRGGGGISFRDLQHLLEKLGFRLNRVSGSHHIYIHPKVPRPVNIQSVGKDAKPYQVRQVRDIIEQFRLKLEE
jgi:predicted RNA binding protein YcfA (HicA-like mRNA interferase family)